MQSRPSASLASALVLAVAAFVPTPAGAQPFHGVGGGNIAAIDSGTGLPVNAVGTTAGLANLASGAGGGSFFALGTGGSQLGTVDPLTGIVTPGGTLGVVVRDLSYHAATGTLFGVSTAGTGSSPFTLHEFTLAGTVLNSQVLSGALGNGSGSGSGGAFNASNGLATAFAADGSLYFLLLLSNSDLRLGVIDPSTGTGSILFSVGTNFLDVGSLEFDQGLLYGFAQSDDGLGGPAVDSVFSVDPTDGTLTTLFNPPTGTFSGVSLMVVPEPGSVLAGVAATGWLAWAWRRRKQARVQG